MKHAKRIISLLLCLVLACGFAFSVAAEELHPQPRWSYISSMSGGVTETEMSGNMVLNDFGKYATIYVVLQKYSGGWADTSISCRDEGYGIASASTSLNLSSGRYRAKIVFRVYREKGGAYLEGDTIYSNEYLA